MPLVYFAILVGAIGVFARTRDFSLLLRVGQVDILLAPTLSMIPLGGFVGSGGVGLWGILAPLGALVFGDVRVGDPLVRRLPGRLPRLGHRRRGRSAPAPPLPGWFTTTMLALNIVVGGTIVFTLLAVFAKQRRDALAALREEQAKAENLLLNILPRSIAERLKAADRDDRRPVRFGVDPLRRRRGLHAAGRSASPPAEVVGCLDDLFSHFDELAERYGLEKIKTIGDCYMVAAGVPDAPPRSRSRARADGARHARGDALGATTSATSAWSCGSASTQARSSPA